MVRRRYSAADLERGEDEAVADEAVERREVFDPGVLEAGGPADAEAGLHGEPERVASAGTAAPPRTVRRGVGQCWHEPSSVDVL